MAQLANLSYNNTGSALFMLARPSTIDLSGAILSEQDGELAVNGIPINPKYWSNYSTLHSTIAFNISSATLLATANPSTLIPSLSFDNNILAYKSDIPDLANWAYYQANHNVDISGYDVDNISTLTAQTGYFSTLYADTFVPVQTIAVSTINTSTITAKECFITSSLHLSTVNVLVDNTNFSGSNLTFNNNTSFQSTVNFNNIAPIGLPGITDGGVAASTITASSMFALTLSTSFQLASTIRFAPEIGNIDLGLGQYFGSFGAWGGAAVGTSIGGYYLATGLVGLASSRQTNYITPGAVELVNGTTQIQFSTLSTTFSSITRWASTISGTSTLESFASTITVGPALAVRSFSDPIQTASTGTASYVQAFGEWVAVPASQVTNWSNYSTLNSTIAFNITGATLLAQSTINGPILSFNGNQLAYTTDQGQYAYDFYVAPNGSDSIGNGGVLSPWLTIGYALTQIGSITNTITVTIHIMTGTYTGDISIVRNNTFLRGQLNDPNAPNTQTINIIGRISISPAFGTNQINTGLSNLSAWAVVYTTTVNIGGVCTINNCNFNNTTLTGTAGPPFAQYNSVALFHTVFLNNCIIVNGITGHNAVYRNSGITNMSNTNVTITSANVCCIFDGTAGLTIKYCVVTSTSGSATVGCLLQFPGAQPVDISYTRLIYVSPTVDTGTNKCCIQFTNASGTVIVSNFVQNYLSCEGARVTNGGGQYQCIQKIGAGLANLTYDPGTVCGLTANHISNSAGMTHTPLVVLT